MTEQRAARRAEQALGAWRPLVDDALHRRWRQTVVAEGPRPRGRASLWALGQVVAAALDLHALGAVAACDVRRLLRSARAHRCGRAYAAVVGGTECYYDDNAWLGLDFVQAAGALGEPSHLDGARAVLRFLRRGTRDGGVYWVEHPARARHTCSTGPAAELAFRLALAGDDGGDGDGGTRAFGEEALGFLRRELRRPDGLYADHVDDDGTVDPTVWSYNQGTPVGAGALAARLSGDEAPLALARATADAALAHFGEDDRLWRQPPVFNAIFLRNLLLLDGVAGYPAVQPVLDAYLDRAWEEARHPVTGWFTGGGIGAYEQGGSLDQAGLAQLYALAAWPPSRRSEIC